MFLNLLKSEEKIAFLALARRVMSADKTIAPKERIMLEAMKKEMEISDSELDLIPTHLTIKELCSQLSSNKAKVSALMELIGIGFVDGEFVLEEQEMIYRIAEAMEISPEETKMYIDWARRVYTEDESAA